ncbi:MAG: hypothetical protein OEW44_02345 [Gemmatimonadota bacterium]|nr:hypothetical protein [Gemmatimonadota bacterium]
MRSCALRLRRLERLLAEAAGELTQLRQEREQERAAVVQLRREVRVLRQRKGGPPVLPAQRRKAPWHERVRMRMLYPMIG